jgi:uncharacterized protein (TIGR02266 family)
MKIYCDVTGTILDGPNSAEEMLQALQEASQYHAIVIASRAPERASELLGGARVRDKDQVADEAQPGDAWIAADEVFLRTVRARNVTAIHASEALAFLRFVTRISPRTATLDRCRACGSTLSEDSHFCGYCGLPRAQPPAGAISPASSPPSEVVLLTKRRNGGRERREASRFPLDIEVTYQSEHNFYTGLASNLSTGGLFIATHRPAARGELIDVRFTLPGLDQACTTRCEVRWSRELPDNADFPPGLGLRFIELEPEVRTCIERFLEHREPIFFDDDEA